MAAPPAPPPAFVYIKRTYAGAPLAGEVFAKLTLQPGDDVVADLAARACDAFGWGPPTRVGLALAAAGGRQPAATALAAVIAEVDPLAVDLTLAEAGVTPGAWLLALVPPPPPPPPLHGGGSLRQRFRALLFASGVVIDERVMATFLRSGLLASRIPLVTTAEEAIELYAAAAAVPRTETRAHARAGGVVIDGDMLVPGVQTALFLHAFKGFLPRVLKVPAAAGAAERECALWAAVSREASAADIALVPVELLELRQDARHETHTGGGRADVLLPGSNGVLMPHYAATLERVPAPARADYVAVVVTRMETALRFIHDRGWLHGDVKPSNIFLDAAGVAWLGDYGTAVRAADAATAWTGGTPAFQCWGVEVADAPLRFDLVGLALSALSALGLIAAAEAPAEGWPPAALEAAVARVEDAALRAQLRALIAEG